MPWVLSLMRKPTLLNHHHRDGSLHSGSVVRRTGVCTLRNRSPHAYMELELAKLLIKLIEAEEHISRTQLPGSIFFPYNFVQIDSLHIKMQ